MLRELAEVSQQALQQVGAVGRVENRDNRLRLR